MLVKILQALPEFKGKTRLSKFLFRNTINTAKDVIIAGQKGLKYKVPNFIEPIGLNTLMNGVHEKETSEYIMKRVPRNGVFADIGANIGTITLFIASQRTDLKIFSVEASPRVFRYMKENIEMNGIKNCTLINLSLIHI